MTYTVLGWIAGLCLALVVAYLVPLGFLGGTAIGFSLTMFGLMVGRIADARWSA